MTWTFDPTINLGVVIHGIVMLIGIAMATVKVVRRFALLEHKVNVMWKILIGSEEEPGLEGKIEHAVRNVLFGEPLRREAERRAKP